MDWLESEIIGNLKGVNVCIEKFEKDLENADTRFDRGLISGALNTLRIEKGNYEKLLRHFETTEHKEKHAV
jgi:hypothetical protein